MTRMPLLVAWVVAVDLVTKGARFRGPVTREWFYGITAPPAPWGLLLSLTIAALIVGAVWWAAPPSSWWGAALVGAVLCNQFDRVAYGGVRDWWVVGPVTTNVADLALLLGLAGWLTYATKGGTCEPDSCA